MSGDAISTGGVPKPWWNQILWYTGFVLVSILTFSVLFVLVAVPEHLLLGWFFHGTRTLPTWLAGWRAAMLPAGCLVMAGVLLHRFIHRLHTAWRLRDTVASLVLLLSGCGAAIALSGVIHEAVWLMGRPVTEVRGKRTERTNAVNSARQLAFALIEFHDENGNYPSSLAELREKGPPERIEIGEGQVKEPFILLLPGRMRPAAINEAILISPLVEHGTRFVVGYGDGSVRAEPAKKLTNILQGVGNEPSVESPR